MVMNKKKVCKYIFILIFLVFLIGYVIERTGYYEYNLQNKTTMTNEAMKRFEEDIQKGKDVTIEDYIVNTEKDYTSSLTRGTNKFAIKINTYLKKGIEEIFKVLGNFVNE